MDNTKSSKNKNIEEFKKTGRRRNRFVKQINKEELYVRFFNQKFKLVGNIDG